jgi:hypothetical protein
MVAKGEDKILEELVSIVGKENATRRSISVTLTPMTFPL